MQQYIYSTIQDKPYCCHLNLVQRDYHYDVLTAHLQRTCTLNDLLPSSPITFTDNFPFPASFRSGYSSKVSQYTISTQITNLWNIFLDCNCSVNSIFPILCHCISIGAAVNPQQERWSSIQIHSLYHRISSFPISINGATSWQLLMIDSAYYNMSKWDEIRRITAAWTCVFVRHVGDYRACRRPKSRQHDRVDERKILLLEVLLLVL